MKSCHDVQNHLSSYLDEEINVDLRKQIDEHAAVCPRCKSILNNGYAVKNYMKGLLRLKTSEAFELRLRERISKEITGKRGTIINWREALNFVNRKPIMGFAAAAAIVAAVIAMNNYNSGDEKFEIPASASFRNKIINTPGSGIGTNIIAGKSNKNIPNKEANFFANPVSIDDSTNKNVPKLFDGNVIHVKSTKK